MLCLVRTKACKRCGGDLSLECDIYGIYVECIQCGATWNENDLIPPTTPKTGEHPKTETAKSLGVTKQKRYASPSPTQANVKR